MNLPSRLALGSVALLLGGASIAWSLHSRSNPPPAVTTTATHAPSNPSQDVGCLGRIEPASRIRRLAQPESMGNITVSELLVSEGQPVAAGTLLARFGDFPRRHATIQQAAAELAYIERRLEQVLAGARPGEIDSALARVQREEARVASAQRELLRFRHLTETGAATRSEIDSRDSDLRVAQADFHAARDAAAAIAEIRQVDVALAQADVARARAALELARSEATLSELRAPIAGTILRIHARTGEIVGNNGVLEMADLTAIDAVAEVYETEAAWVHIGAHAEVILPGGRRLPGVVSELGWSIRKQDLLDADPVGDIDTRVVEARVRLDANAAIELARSSNLRVQVVIRSNPAPDPQPESRK